MQLDVVFILLCSMYCLQQVITGYAEGKTDQGNCLTSLFCTEKYVCAENVCHLKCKCGDLMLINESVLAICLSYGEWYPIPGHHWTLTEAKVACRQLGKNPIGAENITLTLDQDTCWSNQCNVQFCCNGSESFLRDCLICYIYDYKMKAGLKCGDWPSPYNLSMQQLESSIQLNWKYNINRTTNMVLMFNLSCESKQQQISHVYSKTILYNNDSTFNTSITGLLPNTIYNCCLLAVTSNGKSGPICENITITGNTTSQICSSTNMTDVFTTSVIKTTATTVTIMTTVTSHIIPPSSNINTKTLCPTGSMTTVTTVTISPSCTINTIKTLCHTGSMTIVTSNIISPSCTINTIKTLCPTGSSDTFTNGSSWVGGILVGVVIGVLVMVMVWVIVTIVRKKRRKMVDNIITYNNSSTSQTSNTEGLGNPTYDGLVHPITNMELPEAEAAYSYAVMPQTHKYDTVANITEERPRVNQDIPINSGIYSPAENIEIEGVAEDEIGTYSKLQRK